MQKNDLKYIKCDFCNSNQNQTILKSKDYVFKAISGEYSIVKCLKCKLIYTNPRLKTNALINYYLKTTNFDNRPIDLNKKNRFNLFLRKDILTEFFGYPFYKKKILRKLIQYPNFLRIKRTQKKTGFIPYYIKKGKILEIGCSYGTYIYQLKKLGWIVKGIELNNNAVDYAKKNFNLNIESKRIEDFEEDEKFDIIYLYMVLEHLESPKIVLQKCFNLLSINGKLILSVPDFSGLETKIHKKYAYTLQLPFHFYHFTPVSIKNYLKNLNFKKIKIVHQKVDKDLIAPFKYKLNDNPNNMCVKLLYKFCSYKFVKKTIIYLFITFLAYLGKTSRMTIVAEK